MLDKFSLIADTLHGSIMLSGFEKDIMITTLFNRLHGIYQNSTAYLTFPANRTRRIEHSFGCMYLCGNIFHASLCNAGDSTLEQFFRQSKKEIHYILNDIVTANHGKQYEQKLGKTFKRLSEHYKKLHVTGGIYNYNIPANISNAENRKLYIILFSGIRVAALLHDIGHPPFSHISENALNILFKKLEAKKNHNKKEEDFLHILKDLIGGDHQLHEQLGADIASQLLMDAISDITEDDARDIALYEKQLFRILVKETAIRILTESTPFFKDLHSIIDGTLDGDRLDYVSRDPENSGFTLGTIEYDRLISKMKLCEKQGHFLFCPGTAVVNAVEDFLMRRWNLYKNIIFHHRVVKTDYLLQNVVVKIAEDYFSSKARTSTGSDTYILPYDISGLWKANRRQPSSREEAYAISQWDDTWLLTILKKSYFETYIDKKGDLHDQLEELLTNKKNYISLIKRKEDFEEMDVAVSKVILSRQGELQTAINALKLQGQHTSSKKPVFDIEGYLSSISDILELANINRERSFVEQGGFILYSIKNKLFGVDSFSVLLKKAVQATGYEPGQLFFVEKELKPGTTKDLYFYRNIQGREELVPLNNISNIANVLKNDVKFSPFFFIYLNRKTQDRIDISSIRNTFGTHLGNIIIDFILDKLNTFLDKE